MTDLSLPAGPRDHVRGAADAAVTLVEYADVECPYCRRLAPVLQQVLTRRPRVRLVYRHFPLVREHPLAYSAALALEAAGQQGRFWELHDRVLSEPARLGRSGLAEHATQLGLNPAELLRPASEQHDGKVREDFQSGMDSGVQGTPGVFVNGLRLLRAPTLPQLLDAVDRAAAP
ncbi:MAG: DsbA family protein [Actinobacteria bacterium]|nr:DsbA family protein [Actinomycetota bacterium]